MLCTLDYKLYKHKKLAYFVYLYNTTDWHTVGNQQEATIYPISKMEWNLTEYQAEYESRRLIGVSRKKESLKGESIVSGEN